MPKKTKVFLLLFLCVCFSVFAGEKEDIDFANGLYERGYYGLAIEEYDKFIKNYPKSKFLTDAYFREAKASYELKEYSRAKKLFERFLKIEKKTKRAEDAELMYALCLKYLGNRKKAYRVLREFVQKYKNSDLLDAVYFMMADLEESFSDYLSAAKHYDMAYKLGGKKSVEALYERGFALIMAKKIEKAVSVYEEICKNFSEKKDIYYDSLFKLGKLYFNLNKNEKSLKCFEKLLESGADKSLKQKAFIMFLKCLSRMNLPEKMEKLISQKQLLIDNNLKCEAFSLLAFAYNSTENHDKTIEYCNYVLKNCSKEESYYNLCVFLKLNSLFKKKEYEKFLVTLSKTKGLHLKKEYLQKIFYMEGIVRERLGQYELAQKAYFKFLKISGNAFNDMVLSAYLNRAECFSKLGEFEKAHNVISELIKKYSGRDFLEYAYVKDAEYLNNLGRIKEAVNVLETFIEKYPRSKYVEDAVFAIVSEAVKIENYEKMEKYLKMSLKLFSNKKSAMAKALYWLGWNELRKNNYEKAEKYYKKIYVDLKDTKYYQESAYWLGVISLYGKKYDSAYNYLLEVVKNKNCEVFSYDVLSWFVESALNKKMFETAYKADKCLKNKAVSKEDIDRVRYYEILCLNGLGKYDKAKKVALQVIENDILNDYEENILFALVDSYIGLKDYNNALKMLDKISKKALENPKTLFEIDKKKAEIEEKKGNYKEAAKRYLRIAILYENDYCPEAAYKAYKIFRKIGDLDSAEKCRKEILSRWPNSKQAQQIKND